MAAVVIGKSRGEVYSCRYTDDVHGEKFCQTGRSTVVLIILVQRVCHFMWQIVVEKEKHIGEFLQTALAVVIPFQAFVDMVLKSRDGIPPVIQRFIFNPVGQKIIPESFVIRIFEPRVFVPLGEGFVYAWNQIISPDVFYVFPDGHLASLFRIVVGDSLHHFFDVLFDSFCWIQFIPVFLKGFAFQRIVSRHVFN